MSQSESHERRHQMKVIKIDLPRDIEQIELHIETLIWENYVEDDCFTRSGTIWRFK